MAVIRAWHADGLVDMDLSCKGEQLGLECDEELSCAPSLEWVFGSSKGQMRFMPVDNSYCRSESLDLVSRYIST